MKIYIQKYIEKHVERILMDLFLQLDKQINCKENNVEYIMTSKCYRITKNILYILYQICNILYQNANEKLGARYTRVCVILE